jgi:uncharacterized damage-inducible protein DinB
MTRPLQKLATHLAWADAEALRCLQETRGADDRALTIYSHVVAAEAVWLARIAGRRADVAIWPTLTLDEAAALARRNADELASLLASSNDDTLDAEIVYRNSSGTEFRSTIEDILLHVALHGAYHRGQVSLLVRSGGGEPVPTDYIAFVRGAPAARTEPAVPLTQTR